MTILSEIAVLKTEMKFLKRITTTTFIMLLGHLGYSISPQVLPMILGLFLA